MKFSACVALSFLGRDAASKLVYSNTKQNDHQKREKAGPKRTLSVQEGFHLVLGNLSIENEIGRRRQPEVKFSRANLVRMSKVVKTSSSFRRQRNSGSFAILAKT